MSTRTIPEDEVLSNISGDSKKSSESSKPHRHQAKCHHHHHGHHRCYCIKQFYEEDEVCRKNEEGKLEFGIVSRYEGSGMLKIFWTLDREIQEEDLLQDTDAPDYTHLRLIDRMSTPGDLIKVNKKQGEVQEVSWNAVIKLQENNSVLLDIPCERLEPLIPHYPGQKVVEESGWIGTITNVYTEATLMFSKGKTAIVDCTFLPQDQQPYPGRKVRYTLNQFLAAGLEKIGTRRLKDIYKDHEEIEAFVLFLNVASVHVQWNGRVSVLESSSSSTSDSPPSSSLSRNYLKRHVKVLGTPKDFDWDNHPEAVERLYNCVVRNTDEVLNGGDIEEYLENKFFRDCGGPTDTVSSSVVGDDMGRSSKIMTNVEYVCRVLRFSRVLKVKWVRSGKVDKIRANIVTSKHSFGQPYHQIVQRKVSLTPYSYDEYGVSLIRDLNDTLSVKWLSRPRDISSASETEYTAPPTFRTKYQSLEPVFDVEPHFSYGRISPGSIVYRSLSCRLPEPLFSIGWVRSVTQAGQVLIVSMHTRVEHYVYPNELECTGISVDNSKEMETKLKNQLVVHHGLYNLQISDQLFAQNLAAVENSKGMPEHWKMLPKAPSSHFYFQDKFLPPLEGRWYKAVKRDQLYLSSKLDDLATIWLKGFKDRPDLYNVLIAGLQGTPYEGGLFAFDVQLGPNYPNEPPTLHCTTVFNSVEFKLELLDQASPPYKLIESLVQLQNNLFGNSLDVPSSAASLQKRKLSEDPTSSHNMRLVIDVLDLMFRNVFDPPHMWVNECLQYFKMSYERVKRKLVKIVDGVDDGEDYSIQPVTDGWIDSVVGRFRRFDDLVEEGSKGLLDSS